MLYEAATKYVAWRIHSVQDHKAGFTLPCTDTSDCPNLNCKVKKVTPDMRVPSGSHSTGCSSKHSNAR